MATVGPFHGAGESHVPIEFVGGVEELRGTLARTSASGRELADSEWRLPAQEQLPATDSQGR